MIRIIFESHGTTFDNENRLSSGHYDVGLSPLGEKQAMELGERYMGEQFEAIFCSDLQRSYRTAEIAFYGRNINIIKDARLRECCYGDLTHRPSDEVEPRKSEFINSPFPNGESYEDCSRRMKEFLRDLLKNYNGKTVMIIGHRATQYGLEHWIKGVPLRSAVTASWLWQPGWEYHLSHHP